MRGSSEAIGSWKIIRICVTMFSLDAAFSRAARSAASLSRSAGAAAFSFSS